MFAKMVETTSSFWVGCVIANRIFWRCSSASLMEPLPLRSILSTCLLCAFPGSNDREMAPTINRTTAFVARPADNV